MQTEGVLSGVSRNAPTPRAVTSAEERGEQNAKRRIAKHDDRDTIERGVTFACKNCAAIR